MYISAEQQHEKRGRTCTMKSSAHLHTAHLHMNTSTVLEYRQGVEVDVKMCSIESGF